jgi:hypothetical protein
MIIRRKTAGFEGDANFAVIGERINASLSSAGYQYRPRTGSLTWLGKIKSGGKPTTLFKLCRYSDGQVVFGVRSEFVDAHARLQTLRWPIEFSVPPDASALFHGMQVTNDEMSLVRVERILAAFAPQDRNIKDLAYEERQAQFDDSLDKLGL